MKLGTDDGAKLATQNKWNQYLLPMGKKLFLSQMDRTKIDLILCKQVVRNQYGQNKLAEENHLRLKTT